MLRRSNVQPAVMEKQRLLANTHGELRILTESEPVKACLLRILIVTLIDLDEN